MSNRAMLRRRYRWEFSAKDMADHHKRLKNCMRPGFGMGMGKNTLIHKGKKP